MKLPLVPRTSQCSQPCCDRFWHAIDQSAMKSHRQSDRTPTSQRHVVSWNVNPLKPISLFEFAQATGPFFPICELCVEQITNMSIVARPHRLYEQHIGWCLISLLQLRAAIPYL